MESMITLVVCDLDETLLNEEKQISVTDRRAIEQLKDKGILFGVISGHPVESTRKKLREWKIEGSTSFILGMNGGTLYDAQTQKIEEYHKLKGDVLQRIFHHFQDVNCILQFYQGDVRYVSKSTQRTRNQADSFLETEVLADVESLILTESFNKVTLYAESNRMPEVLEKMITFKDPDCMGFLVDPNRFEFSDPRINKGYGLKKLCQHYGVAMEHILAFGNATNDIPMLSTAGIGVCVQNATDDVKAICDVISPYTNDESAIGNYLNENLL